MGRRKQEAKTFGKRMMTVQDVAAYVGMSDRTIYDQTAPGAKKPFPVKPKRIGALVRFDKQDIDEWLDSL